MAVSFLTDPKGMSIVCDSCLENIINTIRVQCSECQFDQCVSCFLNQTETDLHRKTHRYRVIDKMEHNFYIDEWTFQDTILFIEAMEICGIGNFIDISQYLGDNEGIKNFFYKLFEIKADFSLESDEVLPVVSNPHCGNLDLYMPKRKDFDVEFMNDQEFHMKDLAPFNEKDSVIKKDFIIHALDAYKKVLSIRNRRKYFIFEKNMLDLKKLKIKNEISNTEYIKDIKFMAQYLTKQDFNIFYRGLYIERCLHSIIFKKMKSEIKNINVDQVKNCNKILNKLEKDICKACKISDRVYLVAKRVVINFYLKNKNITKDDLKKILGASEQRASFLYNFFKNQDWIHESPKLY